MDKWLEHFYPFAIIYMIWVLVFFSQNLYNLNFTKNNIFFFKTLSESFFINIFIATFFFYFTTFFGIAPKTNLFLNVLISGILLFTWRFIYNLTMSKQSFKTKVAFLGYSEEVNELIKAFKNEPQLGYQCVVVVSNEPISNSDVQTMSMDEFLQNVEKLDINTIAIHHGKIKMDEKINEKLYKLMFKNINFINLLRIYEEITAKVPTSLISEGWFLDNIQESEKKIYDKLKVAMDVVLALLMLFVFLILLIPISLITLITSGRPIFYSQKRIGEKDKSFKIHKFRTMIKNAEQGNAQFASINDNRITKFGKFLRTTRLDELPQVINILKGEMSFIGPRPERPEFVTQLEQEMPFYSTRHLAKPGLTGWAQINYPYAGTIAENLKKLQYDIYYIKNRSLLLDFAIILKTFNIIIRFKGR